MTTEIEIVPSKTDENVVDPKNHTKTAGTVLAGTVLAIGVGAIVKALLGGNDPEDTDTATSD